jgi:hypothetical protein
MFQPPAACIALEDIAPRLRCACCVPTLVVLTIDCRHCGERCQVTVAAKRGGALVRLAEQLERGG